MGARRGRLSAIAFVAVAAVVTATVVAVLAARDDGAKEVVVADEHAGVLRDVRFGDTAAEVRARLGEPADTEDGFFPAGTDYTGPPAIPSPRSDQGTRTPPETVHYDEAAFLVSPTVGVYSMAVLAEGARTRAGVGVGDPLARVRAAYERVSCGEAVAGEALFGGETPKYPWCRAIVGDVRVFFGADPIESITLTRLGAAPAR